MIKIIVDMNLPPRWVPVLKAEGWDAVHWSSIGIPGAADADIMKYAKRGGYAVLTHDLDFGAILAATAGNAPSVIQVRTQDVFPEAIGRLVTAAIHQFKNEIEKGVLISVDGNRSRARLLPWNDSACIYDFSVPAEVPDANGPDSDVDYVRWMIEAVHRHSANLPGFRAGLMGLTKAVV